MGKLHIVGGGAIGSLIAASAQKNGVPYDCYPRDRKSMPSWAQWQDGQTTMLKPAKFAPVTLAETDVLILPLKVYQLNAALLQWLPYLTQQPTVVLLHNGMGGLETATELLGYDYPLLLATTSHGALKVKASTGDVYVQYTGVGATQIGAPQITRLHVTVHHLTRCQPSHKRSPSLPTRLPRYMTHSLLCNTKVIS